jgi:hypothetical protein
MPYTPASRRNNIIRARCTELVRRIMPHHYSEIVAAAEALVPKKQRGRPRGVVEASPRMTRRRQHDALQAE